MAAGLALGLALGVATFACGGKDSGAGGTAAANEADAAGAKKARRDGRMRLADTWLEVTPIVINEAKMDLATLCQMLRDEEKKAGKADALLCYDPTRRAAAAVKTLRVELRKGSFRDLMPALADRSEGAHVVADKTGTIYQILDFALAARRDGSVRGDEVRLIAIEDGGKKALDALLEELKPTFPDAKVEIVEVAATPPTPAPDADAGAAGGADAGAAGGADAAPAGGAETQGGTP